MTACTVKMRIMWQCWILMLCATGIFSTFAESQINRINPSSSGRKRNSGKTDSRFVCPEELVRIKKKCYYLSRDTATWDQAFWGCKDRNMALATPDRKGRIQKLTRYLMGQQDTKLERWIGGRWDWGKKNWKWAASGLKIEHENFEHNDVEGQPWDCIVMDPKAKFKWEPRSCLETKHYICEVPAVRKARTRNDTYNPNAIPRNQPIKLRRSKNSASGRRIHGKNHVPNGGEGHRDMKSRNEQWANGIALRSKPPMSMKVNGTRRGHRRRHRTSKRLYGGKKIPKITQLKPQGQEYGSFLGDGPKRTPYQGLSDDNAAMNQFHSRINDISVEEILLKT